MRENGWAVQAASRWERPDWRALPGATPSCADRYPKAARYLAAWTRVVRSAAWRSLADVRATYPSADMVRVGSGRRVLVFNVCRNDYRLIVAVHFERQIAYMLRFLAHGEYSRDRLKNEL